MDNFLVVLRKGSIVGLLIVFISSLGLTNTAFAHQSNTCHNWFESKDISVNDPECVHLCVGASVGLGTSSCKSPGLCEHYCTPQPIEPELGADCDQDGDSRGCPVWQVNKENLNMYVVDTPLWYDSPVGPSVSISVSYNSRGDGQDYHGLGANWLLNYSASITFDGNDAVVRMPDGAKNVFVADSVNTGEYATPDGVYDELETLGSDLLLTQRNGQLLLFRQINSGIAVWRLVEWRDVNGFALTFAYSNDRLVTITDAQSRVTQLVYTGNRLTRVNGPFGRHAEFTYTNTDQLQSIIDMGGLQSLINYDSNGMINLIDKPDFGQWAFKHEPSDNSATSTDHPAPDAAMGAHYRLTITDPEQRKMQYFFDAIAAHTWKVEPKHYVPYVSVSNNNSQSLKTTYRYTSNYGKPRLSSMIDELGQTTSYDYFSNGLLSEKIDPDSIKDEFVYTNSAQMSERREDVTGQNRLTQYTYLQEHSNLVSQISAPSVLSSQLTTTTTSYDSNRFVDRVTINGFTEMGLAVSREVDFDYNAQGQLLRIDGPRTDVQDITTFTYYDCVQLNLPPNQAECGQMKTQTNATGHVTTFDSYTTGGLLAQSTDANGLVRQYVYDGLNRLTLYTEFDQSASNDKRETSFSYIGAKQHIASITYPDGIEYTLAYDAAEQLSSITDNLGNQTQYLYDDNGKVVQTDVLGEQNQLETRLTQTYDAIDRRLSVTLGNSVKQYAYNGRGLLNSSIDPNQNPATSQQYDGLDRMNVFLDRLGNATNYSYNVSDQLTQVQAPNGVTTDYEYDDLNNQLKETSADRGVISYVHDAAGNITQMQDARNIVLNNTYDELNRLVSTNREGELQSTQYAYDNCTHGVGRVCQINDLSGQTQFTYDIWGNFSSVQRTNHALGNAQTYLTQYQYDAGNRITQITYPSGRIVNYQYDALGRSTQVVSDNQTLLNNRQYRADKQFTSQQYGNGLIETREYDNQARLDTIKLNNSGVESTLFDYDYDANSNILNFTGISNQTQAYDALDRLDTESGLLALDYDYDANGNRLSFTEGINQTSISYEANSNRLLDIAADSVQTDAAGNIASYQGKQFHYNDYGQLETLINQGQVVNYAYDANWQRSRKRHGSWMSDYHYDLQGRLIGISDGNGQVQMEYVYADAGAVNPFARIRHTSNTIHTVESGLGILPAPNNNVNLSCNTPVNSLDESLPSDNAGDLFDSNTDQSDAESDNLQAEPAQLQALTPEQRQAQINEFLPILYYMLLFDEGFNFLDDVLRIDDDVNQVLTSDQATLVWNTVTGADQYVVAVSTDPNSLSQGQGAGVTTYCNNEPRLNVDNLTPNAVHYIRVWAEVNGNWQYQDYVINRDQTQPTNQTELLYLIQDHLGTPRQAINENRTTAWQWNSDGFGKALPNEDPDNNGQKTHINLRFAGQYFDEESQLHYNWHRYYDPKLGRYITSDPIGLNSGLNTFGYSIGNPVKYFDSDGLRVRFICRRLAGVSGAVTSKQHCFVHVTCPSEGWSATYSLFATESNIVGWPNQGAKEENGLSDNPASPNNASDGDADPNFCYADECGFEKAVRDRYDSFPEGNTPYSPFGPNSNSFAQGLITGVGGLLPANAPNESVAPGIDQDHPNFP